MTVLVRPLRPRRDAWHRVGWLFWGGLVISLLFGLFGCVYDAEEAENLGQVRSLVDPSVQDEVTRVKALFEKMRPTFKGLTISAPVPDAFNDQADPDHPLPLAYGGRIRIAVGTEPKRLTQLMDTSAITGEINRYVYNGLVYVDPDTLKTMPDLAKRWETADIIWLQGHHPDSVFKRRESHTNSDEDNNYVVGTILLDTVQWADESETVVKQLTAIINGEARVFAGDELRLRVNEDGSYKRMFDRKVVYTFELRDDVVFHNGQPFTADDVIFTLNTISNPKIPEMTPTRSLFLPVKYWQKLGQYKVQVFLDEQQVGALELFAGPSFPVLSKDVFVPKGMTFTEEEFAKHFRDHPAIDKPVGTGPYCFPSDLVDPEYLTGDREAWQRSNYIRVTRTGHFFDPYRRGYLDDIYWYFYPGGGATILLAMNNDELDFTIRFGSEEIFKKSNSQQFKEKYAKVFFFTPSYGYITLNHRKIYFKDKRVRQAFAYLLDLDRFNKNVSYGIAIPVSGPNFNFGPAYNHDVEPYHYDRVKAERLLNEAGWVDTDGDGLRDKDGVPFDVEIILPPGKGGVGASLGTMLREELADIGVSLNLRRLEWATLLEHIEDRKFDMYSLAYLTSIESDPFSGFHSSQWAARGQNGAGYSNLEADQIMLQIRRELDDEKRMVLHHKLQRILQDDVAQIFLFNYPDRGAYNKRIRNVKFSGKRPGYFAWQWYIPESLQTPDERTKAKERWKGATPHPLTGPTPMVPARELETSEQEEDAQP